MVNYYRIYFVFLLRLFFTILGACSFTFMDTVGAKSNKIRLAHRCDMGISVLKEYWGLGIASEIMKVIIDKAKEVGFEQIEFASSRH